MILRALTIQITLYTALAVAANSAAAQTLDDDARAAISALRAEDMRKLVIHEVAVPAPPVAYIGPDGGRTTLAASDGKLRVLNFWATWCAPCREEMPALDALAQGLGGPDFEVMLIATGRNSSEAIERFFAEEKITSLRTGLDPDSSLAQAMGIPGLPVTVILNREGQEIARLLGGADWNAASARAIMADLLAR